MISWILTGCPEMQWSSTGYGIEIRDISAVSPPPSFLFSSVCVYDESRADGSSTKMVSFPSNHDSSERVKRPGRPGD
jgi:hypothetical protein